MLLRHDGLQFIFSCAFTERHHAQRAGFKYIKKRFVTQNAQVAARLRVYADDSAKGKLAGDLITVTPWSGRIRYPKGLTPRSFQETAVRFAVERNRSYLALDPGLGKGVIAALICNAHAGRIIITVPPFLALNMRVEVEKWASPKTTVRIFENDWPLDERIIIMPDSMLHRDVAQDILNEGGTALIVDEAHRYKSGTAKRSCSVFGIKELGDAGLIDLFDRTVLMSGTPMPNRPMELFLPLSRCAPETIGFMNSFRYGMRYCGGHIDDSGHYDFSGASRLDELFGNVKKKFMLRMRKEDVLKELPPMQEQIIFIGENLPPKAGALERKLLAQHSPEDLLTHLSPHTSTYRRLLGAIKVKPAIGYIKERLDCNDDPIVVFAIHKEVVKKLAHGLRMFRPLVIDGSVPKNKRQAIVDEFQKDKRRRVIICNIDAGGVGFTMTKSRLVVLVEYSWVPGVNKQAGDRIHRIGQTGECVMQYLVFLNSLDRTVLETNLSKRANANKL